MSVRYAVCICAAERGVIGWGNHYDNNHKLFREGRILIGRGIFVLSKLIGLGKVAYLEQVWCVLLVTHPPSQDRSWRSIRNRLANMVGFKECYDSLIGFSVNSIALRSNLHIDTQKI